MESRKKDIIIIGAGSTGSSVAYNLSKTGNRVTVIDQLGVAGGNTGKSSALIRTHYSNEIIAKMALYSFKVISHFEDIGYSGFRKTGMIFPFHDRDVEIAKRNVRMLKSIGIDEKIIEPTEIRGFYDDVNLDNFDFVTYEPESGYADPVATSNSFMEKAKESGAVMFSKKKAVRVDNKGENVRVTLDDGKELSGGKVILATNVWTNDLLSESGVSKSNLLPISASMHGIIYIRRPKQYSGLKPTLWDPPHTAYYKMEGETVTAIGSLDPKIDREEVDIHGFIPETVTQEYLEGYLERIVSRLPSMRDATVISSLTGLYDMTPDGQAIIDSLSGIGLDNVYVCAGLSGHGFKLSPAYGKIVADMINGEDPEKSIFDWRPFNMRRFREGKLIKSLYDDIATIY